MATSRSPENTEGSWVGVAHLLSGRPDPTWDVPLASIEELQKMWASLERWTGDVPRGAPLGYRGCGLRGPDRAELFAYGGVATMKGAGITGMQTRKDSRRQLERTILATAPPSLIPASILERLE